MRSASLLTAPGIPRFVGPSPKEEGDSKKRPHTHDANGYQATNKRPLLFSKYLVYQVLPRMSVSRGTLCLIAPPHPRGLGDVSVECGTPGQKVREGELALTDSMINHHTLHETTGPCPGTLSAGAHRLSSAFLA